MPRDVGREATHGTSFRKSTVDEQRTTGSDEVDQTIQPRVGDMGQPLCFKFKQTLGRQHHETLPIRKVDANAIPWHGSHFTERKAQTALRPMCVLGIQAARRNRLTTE